MKTKLTVSCTTVVVALNFFGAFALNDKVLAAKPAKGAAQQDWQLQTTLSGNPTLSSVKVVSQDVAWTCSINGTVYRTTDGGKNWVQTARVTTTESVFCIEALDATTAFVGAGPISANGNAKIYRTTNTGGTWNIVYTTATIPAGLGWNAIYFFDAQNGIAQCDRTNLSDSRFLIVKTTDGGTTWTPIANPPQATGNALGFPNSFYFYDQLNGWFGTFTGLVFRTIDGGDTWTGFRSGNTNIVTGVRFTSPMVGARTSIAPPYLARSTDGGQTWTPVTNLPISNIQRMFLTTGINTPNMNQLWLSGDANSPFVLSSTDGAATWQQQSMANITSGTSLVHMSAVLFGALSDSVQAFGVTLNINTFASGGQILNYRQRTGFLTAVKEEQPNLPLEYTLSQNYPNPFNPETRINYALAKAGKVVLKIFNLQGQEVRALVNEFQPAGAFEVLWDGKDDAGRQMSSGTYLYQIEAQGLVQTKKMVLLR